VRIRAGTCLIDFTHHARILRCDHNGVGQDSLSNLEVSDAFTKLSDFSSEIGAENSRVSVDEVASVLHLLVHRIYWNCSILYQISMWTRLVRLCSVDFECGALFRQPAALLTSDVMSDEDSGALCLDFGFRS
jgi:hypothetical protein